MSSDNATEATMTTTTTTARSAIERLTAEDHHERTLVLVRADRRTYAVAAFVVDVAGEWRAFREAVQEDYGGNELGPRRTADQSLVGINARVPGLPTRVGYHGDLGPVRAAEERQS
jgi:hypothetical protein